MAISSGSILFLSLKSCQIGLPSDKLHSTKSCISHLANNLNLKDTYQKQNYLQEIPSHQSSFPSFLSHHLTVSHPPGTSSSRTPWAQLICLCNLVPLRTKP